jgi:hypothetical protein
MVVDVIASFSVRVLEMLVELIPHLLLGLVHRWKSAAINLSIYSSAIALWNT